VSIWNWFKSSHTLYLEKEVARLTMEAKERIDYERTEKANLLSRADNEALNQELLYRTQIAELKKAHAAELNRVIEESQRLRTELDQLRQSLKPVERTTQQEDAEGTTPLKSDRTTFGEMVIAGTPWQRILAREIAKQAAEANAKHTMPVETPPSEVTENANG
jgi:regulator of replication initiation timing